MTGSVACKNAPKEADIDLLIVTKRNWMWVTRAVVVGILKLTGKYRRREEKESFCTNMFLDEGHLTIRERNLFTAHEVLQAICIFDRGGTEGKWLEKNRWTREYLPRAFAERLKIAKMVSRREARIKTVENGRGLLEKLAFWGQYWYMRPKMTKEKVGWGVALFHPRRLSTEVLTKYSERLVKYSGMKKLPQLIAVVVLVLGTVIWQKEVWAEECSAQCGGIDECQRKITECQKLLELSVAATKPHEEKVKELEKDMAAIDANMKSLANQVEAKKKEISEDETKLAARQVFLETQIRDFYKKDFQSGLEYLFATLFTGSNVGETLSFLAYRQSLINDEKRLISSIVLEITDLSESKRKLEETQGWLTQRRASLETTLAPVRKLVAEAKGYQTQLTQTVGTLSARQQQLLAEKTGNFVTSVGEVPPADDAASRPDFNPGFSPAYAGFSFGAPHRKGMSQYGAYGRAKSGQNSEEILRAYYGGGIEIKKDYNTGINIRVDGYGEFNIEDYTKRIYEVPNSWADNGGYEALKAQAVAARSYALARTNNGAGSICATEACQVFKPEPKGGNWERAVNDTRGWVLVANGAPFSSWYAASAGGYTYGYSFNGYGTPGAWDTKCGSQGCWTGEAYEKIAGSPWFYKAWYRPRSGRATRSHPWLTQDEFADIVNATLLFIKDGGSLSHLSQTDKPNPDTWSRDEVRNRLGGEAVNAVGSISVSYSTGGVTSTVHIGTDKGTKDISGSTFREIFNLRAPGEIWLASALFNIEKK